MPNDSGIDQLNGRIYHPARFIRIWEYIALHEKYRVIGFHGYDTSRFLCIYANLPLSERTASWPIHYGRHLEHDLGGVRRFKCFGLA